MQLLIASLALASLLAAPAGAAADTRDISKQIESVEAALPAVSKGERTLELSLQAWMDSLRVPGLSVAVIDDYKIAWAKGYGVMVAGGSGLPVDPQTLFQAGSVSKPIAALAVLRQVEAGAFDLDADINRYLRSWKMPADAEAGEAPVTVRQLLAHTAGITPDGFAGYAQGAALPTIAQILEGTLPATNRPARRTSAADSAVSYSGLGYTMLQLALTDRLGKSFESVARSSVFDRVGMRSSTFQTNLPEALAKRAASGHRASGATIEGGWYRHPESAASGLWTTPTDLALLWIEVANAARGRSKRIVSPGMARRMLAQHRDQMGLGFVVRPGEAHGRFAHSGGNQGYRAHVEMLSGTGQGVVVMTNSDAGQLLSALLIRRIAQVHEWPTDQQRPVSEALSESVLAQIDQSKAARGRVELDDDVLKRYVGRYELVPGLEFAVTHEPGQLSVRLGDQPRFPVFAESESKFFFEVVDAQVTFVANEVGHIVSLILHQGGRDQVAKRLE